jgi:hypothetical protein
MSVDTELVKGSSRVTVLCTILAFTGREEENREKNPG